MMVESFVAMVLLESLLPMMREPVLVVLMLARMLLLHLHLLMVELIWHHLSRVRMRWSSPRMMVVRMALNLWRWRHPWQRIVLLVLSSHHHLLLVHQQLLLLLLLLLLLPLLLLTLLIGDHLTFQLFHGLGRNIGRKARHHSARRMRLLWQRDFARHHGTPRRQRHLAHRHDGRVNKLGTGRHLRRDRGRPRKLVRSEAVAKRRTGWHRTCRQDRRVLLQPRHFKLASELLLNFTLLTVDGGLAWRLEAVAIVGVNMTEVKKVLRVAVAAHMKCGGTPGS